MADWVAFFIALWQNCVSFLTECQIFGVPLIGFIVAVFIMGVILRALLVKA